MAIAVEEEIMKQVFKDTGIKGSPHGHGITTISQLEKAIDHERSFDGMFTAEETKRLKTKSTMYINCHLNTIKSRCEEGCTRVMSRAPYRSM